MSVSVLLLTLNEQVNIEACLDSISWCDDVVVLDSGSTDRTVELARAREARIYHRELDNWSAQHNWAQSNIPFKHSWVFNLDADERMTPALRDEILSIAANPDEQRIGFYCAPRNHFYGRWLQRAMAPAMVLRLFKPGKVQFSRAVNPRPEGLDGAHGYLENQFLHYSFNKGLAHWFYKHNSYSTLEAVEGLKQRNGGRQAVLHQLRRLFSRDRLWRRQAFKNLTFHLPCRGLLRSLQVLLLNRGLLDGKPGIAYAAMIALYEHWIELKMQELGGRDGNAASGNDYPSAGNESIQLSGTAPLPGLDVLIPTNEPGPVVDAALAHAQRIGRPVVVASEHDGRSCLGERSAVVHPAPRAGEPITEPCVKGEWVLLLKPHERINPALREAIRQAMASPAGAWAYRIPRNEALLGRALRHGGVRSVAPVRLVRREVARWADGGDRPSLCCRSQGRVDRLEAPLWRIETEAAEQRIALQIRRAEERSIARARRLATAARPLRWWSALRPLWRFIDLYLLRLGILDGRPGFHHASLEAGEALMIHMLCEERLNAMEAESGAKARDGG